MNIFKKILIAILGWESRHIIGKYKPFIVAVTGSVGKTSAKDAIHCVLNDRAMSLGAVKSSVPAVRKSEKSMNSEIGLPLTIIGAPNAWHSVGGWIRNIAKGLRLMLAKSAYPDCLVLEIGADHPGDIRKVTEWLKPDITVMTKVSRTPVHVEFFASPGEVFEEKSYLAGAVKSDGSLILYADDENVASLGTRTAGKNIKVMTYGMNVGADIRGFESAPVYDIVQNHSSTVSGPAGMSFKLSMNGNINEATIRNVLGNACIYPLLAAAAVGKSQRISDEEIMKSLLRCDMPKGRMNIIPGLNGSTIIDDTYNSSPDAALSALSAIKDLNGSGSKIAVLGDMMELGKFSEEEHRKIGKHAAEIVSQLVTVGERSRATADEALKNGMDAGNVASFANAAEALSYLSSVIKPGDMILVKGSQSMRMERVVKGLMKEPDRAAELLVRQEKEWLEKK